MSEDKAIHTLYERIGHLFYAKPYGELGRYLTYYAEERLYLVFDTWYHGFFLVEAKSPKDAIEKVNCDKLEYLPKCHINGTPFDECGFCEHFNCDTCKCEAEQTETQTYITEDRDTQILDAWQVHHRTSTTAVETEPQTDVGTSDKYYGDTAGFVDRADLVKPQIDQTDCPWK